MVPASPPLRPSRRVSLPRFDERRSLGATGLSVSPFCLGTVRDPAAVPAAFDAGINFFFVSADLHWPLYEASRQGLAMLFARGGGVRDRVAVAVASYVTQREFCRAPFHEVLAAIPGLGRIDLTVIGGAHAHEVLIRLEQYRLHRGAGGSVPGVRGVGATFHDRSAAAFAARGALLDLAFCRYNPLHRGAEADLFPRLDPASPTLLYNFLSTDGFLSEAGFAALSLGSEHWRPKITDYYRFALTRPELDGLLCAPETPEQVDALARALEDGPLTEEEVTYLADLADLTRGAARLV